MGTAPDSSFRGRERRREGEREGGEKEWFMMEVYWFCGVASLIVCVRVKRARYCGLVLWVDALRGRLPRGVLLQRGTAGWRAGPLVSLKGWDSFLFHPQSTSHAPSRRGRRVNTVTRGDRLSSLFFLDFGFVGVVKGNSCRVRMQVTFLRLIKM